MNWGYVYIIQGGDRYKIGLSKDLNALEQPAGSTAREYEYFCFSSLIHSLITVIKFISHLHTIIRAGRASIQTFILAEYSPE